MPLRRTVIGRSARISIEEQELLDAPEVQPQGKFTNVEFKEAIRMLSQDVTNQVGQHKEARQEKVETLKFCEFLTMNSPRFIGSSTTTDLENYIEEINRVFDVIHVVAAERVELVAY